MANPARSLSTGRRRWLATPLWAMLASCGFTLRTNSDMPFRTIGITPENGAGVAADLIRYFGDAVRPVAPPRGGSAPQVILDILKDFRTRVVAGVNASGQVVEYELRLTVEFRVRTPQGATLIPATPLELFRSISFSESAVLSKEAEERFLYRDMQSDVVQQLVRRLAAIHLPQANTVAEPASAPRN